MIRSNRNKMMSIFLIMCLFMFQGTVNASSYFGNMTGSVVNMISATSVLNIFSENKNSIKKTMKAKTGKLEEQNRNFLSRLKAYDGVMVALEKQFIFLANHLKEGEAHVLSAGDAGEGLFSFWENIRKYFASDQKKNVQSVVVNGAAAEEGNQKKTIQRIQDLVTSITEGFAKLKREYEGQKIKLQEQKENREENQKIITELEDKYKYVHRVVTKIIDEHQKYVAKQDQELKALKEKLEKFDLVAKEKKEFFESAYISRQTIKSIPDPDSVTGNGILSSDQKKVLLEVHLCDLIFFIIQEKMNQKKSGQGDITEAIKKVRQEHEPFFKIIFQVLEKVEELGKENKYDESLKKDSLTVQEKLYAELEHRVMWALYNAREIAGAESSEEEYGEDLKKFCGSFVQKYHDLYLSYPHFQHKMLTLIMQKYFEYKDFQTPYGRRMMNELRDREFFITCFTVASLLYVLKIFPKRCYRLMNRFIPIGMLIIAVFTDCFRILFYSERSYEEYTSKNNNYSLIKSNMYKDLNSVD